MKKYHFVKKAIVSIAVVMFASGLSFAMGMGDKISLIPEKQAVYDSIVLEHHKKVEPLQTQLWAKETELNTLKGNPKAEPSHISMLVKEAADIKTQLDAAQAALGNRLKNELGIVVTKGEMCPMMASMMGGKGMQHDMMGGMMGGKKMGEQPNNASADDSAEHSAHKKQ